MEQSYYRIGEVSRATGLSKDTLHFYDKIGLLCPEHVDPRNGYRYYSLRNLWSGPTSPPAALNWPPTGRRSDPRTTPRSWGCSSSPRHGRLAPARCGPTSSGKKKPQKGA